MGRSMADYIKLLANGKITLLDVPESVRSKYSFIHQIESYNSDKRHKKTISLFGRRGFDVIHNRFFIERYSSHEIRKIEYFTTFEDYSEVLNGEIYTSACYYQYCFSDEEIEKFQINVQRLNFGGLTENRWKKVSRKLNEEEKRRARKGYRHKNDTFYVYVDGPEKTTPQLNIDFDYFFDFVTFLEGDLSSADLLLCEGMANLISTDGLKLDGAHLRTEVRSKLGLPVDSQLLELTHLPEFGLTAQNDVQTQMVLTSNREEEDLAQTDSRICYISDLHLMHQIKNAGCITEDDAHYYVIQEAQAIASEVEKCQARYLLIAGDISSDFDIYRFFICSLREAITACHIFPIHILITLGNHELWAFPELDFSAIVDKYRTLLTDNHMYLLQNDIYCCDMKNPFGLIRGTESFLLSMTPEKIKDKLTTARTVFFGGLGFSGRDESFNANCGIYWSVVTREEEITQSEKISRLHEKVCLAAQNNTVVVCTHCPARNWTDEKNIVPGVYYVSGHTHSNNYVEDENYHLYEDNQIGYYSHHRNHLKYFDTDGTVDIFADREDGMDLITPEQYIDFNLGKHIHVKCTREHKAIVMYKKYGYYMFAMITKSGSLCIMNGGSIKKISNENLISLYEKMEIVVAKLKEPVDIFTMLLNKVASAVRKIGGRGYIHGCIVDIDYYHHIYVNPFDQSLHAYYAYDMINKEVYESVPSLLYQKLPELYAEYCKQLGEGDREKDSLTVLGNTETDLKAKPKYYAETDMYKYSREIKKYQKLNYNILSDWIDINDENALAAR